MFSSHMGPSLVAAAVDGVRVQDDILNLELDTAHVLLAHGALLGRPLEGGHNGVLDLVDVLHTLAGVHDKVGAGGVRAEAPDLALRQVLVPAEVLRHVLATGLGLVAEGNLALVNSLRDEPKARGKYMAEGN